MTQLRRRRRELWVVVGLLAAAALIAVFTIPFAEGESAGHARGHVVGASAAALVALAAAAFWPPAGSRLSRLARRMFVGGVWLAAGGQILEAVGAFGWDEFNIFEIHPVLTTVHDAAIPVSILALPVVGIGVALAALAVGRTLAERLRTPL